MLEFGYPKVHDGKNTLYSLWAPWRRAGIGIHEPSDAYTGSPWVQYYVGALGVALGPSSGDLYARTAWVRLPFALAGCAGLALIFAAVAPALGRGRARRLAFAALYALLFSASVSLQLHLREARHYPLTVLESGLLLLVFARRQIAGRLRFAAYAAGLCGALLLLFHTFHPAALAWGACCGLWLAARAARREGTARQRLVWLAREGAPLLAAALLTLPLLGFFDFFAQTQGWVERYGDPSRWLRNAGFLAWTLLRHEWLAPVLALRAGALWLASRGEPGGETFRERQALAGFLSLAIAVYAGIAIGIPFLFERYFVVLGPLLCALGLVDLASLLDAARDASRARRHVARAALALAAASLVVGLWVRSPELAGRFAEIRHVYRGPLDYVIPYLVERYPDPSALVIATNYEEPAFMFYLKSRVIVGFYAPDLEQDLTLVPDVIVPRPWPDQLEALQQLASRARYEPHAFPVGNLRWNNTPSLSARVGASAGHRFRDPVVDQDGPELVILERVRDPGPDSSPAAPPAP